MRIIKKWCWALLVLLVLFGCSNEDNSTSSGTDTVLTGVFEDAAVSGLNYSTPSRSGITNGQGEFQYVAGETVTFSIGDIVLGRARGAETVTPFDLLETSSLSGTANPVSVDINHPQVINTLRLLQTLDTDNNPGNGINIDVNARNAANGLQLDLTQPVENFEADPQLLQYLNDATGKLQLVDASSAQQHFERTLGKIGGSSLYSIGGMIFGLTDNLSLHNNNIDVVSVNSDGEFSFPGLMESGTSYNVDIATQPSGQTCTIQNSAGTVASADITSIVITCVDNSQNDPTQILDGTVSGLLGTLILRTNDNINLYINNSTTSFEFTLPVTDTDSYPVVIDTPPAGQTCSIVDRTTITRGDSRNVQIRCTAIVPTHTVGGTISGLASQIELVNNNVDVLTRTDNGSFEFDNPVLDGGSYNVAVRTSPTGQTCRIVNGQGSNVTSDIINIEVTCADSPTTISANVNNLAGSIDVELDTGGQQSENQTASQSSVNFAAPVLHNQQFTLTITRQSESRICTFRENGQESVTRTLDAFNNVPIEIDCVLAHKVNVSVTGTITSELILINNGIDTLSITALGTQTFNRPVKDGENYLISFAQQPVDENCTLQSQNNQPVNSEITLTVDCAPNILPTFNVNGVISGLKEPIVLQLEDQTNNQTFAQQFSNPSLVDAPSYEFSTGLVHGTEYQVSILTQPTGQTCSVDNLDSNPFPRTIDENDVNSLEVNITCVDDPFDITVEVSGLFNDSLAMLEVTMDTGGTETQSLTFDENSSSSQSFPGPLTHGVGYTVLISNQPDEIGQTCSIDNTDSDPFPRHVDANDASSRLISITCEAKIRVNVTGLLVDPNAVLQVSIDTGDSPLTFDNTSDTSQIFPGLLPIGKNYTVEITDQPNEVGQTCRIDNTETSPFPRTIVVDSASSRVVDITCEDNVYTIGGKVSGLSTSGLTENLVLLNNGSDPLTITANGDFQFSSPSSERTGYNVTIGTQPTGQVCAVINGSAQPVTQNVTNVTIKCAPGFSVVVNVTGINGSTVAVENSYLDPLTNQTQVETIDGIASNDSFTFPTPIALNASYTISASVVDSPATQICRPVRPTGIVGASNPSVDDFNMKLTIDVECTARTLVSDLSITDFALADCIAAAATDVTFADEIETLTCAGQDIESLEGIQDLVKLKFLTLNDNIIPAIPQLETLYDLVELNLANNQILHVDALDRLTKLRYLNLAGNPSPLIRDVADKMNAAGNFALASCVQQQIIPDVRTQVNQLTELDCSGKEITSIANINLLRSLRYLDLSDNPFITDIEVLGDLAINPTLEPSSLEVLNIKNTGTREISWISKLTNLRNINLSDNSIDDLSPLGRLPAASVDGGVSNSIGSPFGFDLDGSIVDEFPVYNHQHYTLEVSEPGDIEITLALDGTFFDGDTATAYLLDESGDFVAQLAGALNDNFFVVPVPTILNLASGIYTVVVAAYNSNQAFPYTLSVTGVGATPGFGRFVSPLKMLGAAPCDGCPSVRDISPLSNLNNLRQIDLRNNTALTDISPLSGLNRLTHVDLTNTGTNDSLPSSISPVLVANIVSPTSLYIPARPAGSSQAVVTSSIVFDLTEVNIDSEGEATVNINLTGNTDQIDVFLDPPNGPEVQVFSGASNGSGVGELTGPFNVFPTGDKDGFWILRIVNNGPHAGELTNWSLQLGTNPIVKTSNGIGKEIVAADTSQIFIDVLDDMIVGANSGNAISTINLDVSHPTPADLTPIIGEPVSSSPHPGNWELDINNSGSNEGIINGWDIQVEYQSSP